MIPFDAVARVLGLSSASGTRAALSLLVVGLGAWSGRLELPPHLAILATPAALGALAALAVIEQASQRDDEMRRLLSWVSYGTHGAAGALVAMASARVPGMEAVPPAALGAAGAALAMGTQGLRARLHDALSAVEHEAVSPRKWLTRLENGGAVGLALATLLAPFLALAFVILGVALSVVVLVLARRLEARGRDCCAACDASVRKEASICPSCRAPMEPRVLRDLGLLHVAEAGARALTVQAGRVSGVAVTHEPE